MPYYSPYYELHYRLGRILHCSTLQSANMREMFDICLRSWPAPPATCLTALQVAFHVQITLHQVISHSLQHTAMQCTPKKETYQVLISDNADVVVVAGLTSYKFHNVKAGRQRYMLYSFACLFGGARRG
jgi:hypothetical protein